MIMGINFDEVPDSYQPIKPGIYTARNVELTNEDVKNKPGKLKLVVKHKIEDETAGEANGRELSNHISHDMKTVLKNLYHSTTGERPGAQGFDEQILKDRLCKIVVSNETYEDPVTKQKKETSRVKEYVIPQ